MKSLWKIIKAKRNEFWIKDAFDDSKKHFSQADKHFLLFTNFITCMCTALWVLLFTLLGNRWANQQNDADMKKVIDMVKAYMESATEDEFDAIAQTIRHDLVLNRYNKDIEAYLSYIPNSSEKCCACEEKHPSQTVLIGLNTGEVYPLNLLEDETTPSITFGHDEISQTSLCILKNSVEIKHGDGIVSIHKMKKQFCDRCIKTILNIVKEQTIRELVLFDTEDNLFYAVENAKTIRIGNCALETEYKNENYEITVHSVNEK